uniref:Uncharacterized protein n=1 Tax=viral metagenome TaxID=1070528 RepID=A0A6C0EWY0_9ZZZZ
MLASKLNTQPSIDFFSELSKIVNNKHELHNINAQIISSELSEPPKPSEPSNIIISNATTGDSTEINYCLISKEKLHPNHITLTCNHKFNYIPIYKEVIYQKNKINTLYEITKLSSYQIKCPYCRSITNNLLPYIPYPSVKIIKNVNSPEYDCMNATKCSQIIKQSDANKITTTCNKNALYYEEENVLFCPSHYKKYKEKCIIKEKSSSKDKPSTNTPRCSAILKSGKNVGKPCNSIISIDGSIFCKRHS